MFCHRSIGTNNWNTSKNTGASILGGPYMGGNYYSDYSGTDADGDGIGDTPYSIQGGSNVDYFPLMRIPDNVKTFTASWKTYSYDVSMYAPNCTLAAFNFDHAEKQISFTVAAGTTRYVNVTIPQKLLDGILSVFVDYILTPAIFSTNGTHIYACFTYEQGVHTIKIQGQFVTPIPGDLNHDGKVNILDIVIVAINMGRTE